jgi:ribose 5-phosphate isomerase B
MKIAVASDHAGFPLKKTVIDDLKSTGHVVTDLGTDSAEKPTDYPDAARAVCEKVMSGEAEKGIVICGSGVGVTVAANKFPGIRAGLCHDHYSAHQGVEHDDMNVLCLGARIIGQEVAREIAKSFVLAKYTGEERHARRLNKVLEIEKIFLKKIS